MPAERDVGEITETTRRQADDGSTHGTGVGARGRERPILQTARATESVAFDHGRRRVSSSGDGRLRAAQPDGRVAERRRRNDSGGVNQRQELVSAAPRQVRRPDSTQNQNTR